jgi:hypothetical protein
MRFISNIPTSADLNNLSESGIYTCSTGTPQHAPMGWALYVHKQDIYSGYYTYQYAISRTEYWWRCKVYDNWGDWHRMDNFGCNTLAELKAALAAV